jgi:flagellar protein FlaJ
MTNPKHIAVAMVSAGIALFLVSIFPAGSFMQLYTMLILGSMLAALALMYRSRIRKSDRVNSRNNHSTKEGVQVGTKFMVQSLVEDVLRSGKPVDPMSVVSKFQKYSMISAAIVLPLIAVLIFAAQADLARVEEERRGIGELVEIEDRELLSDKELSHIEEQKREPSESVLAQVTPFLAVALGTLPILILFYPKIMYKNIRKSRKTLVEEELSFFSLYAAIVQSVGIDLYSSFISTIGKDVFKAIENEALLLKRNVEIFARSPLEAMEELGRSHDSMAFRNFLLGYSSIARSGGDLSRYLETRAQENFNLLKLRYSSYSVNVAYLVEALIVVLVIVPILVVVSAFMLPAATISQLIIMSAIAVPSLTIVFAIVLSNIQPKMFNTLGLNDVTVLAFLPTAIISFWLFTLMGFEGWMSLALAAIIPSAVNEYFTTKHRRQIEYMESALPGFLRDITEYRKIGFHEITAIIRIAKENTYNRAFDRLLRTLSRLLEQGYTPVQIMKAVKIRSWFARVTLFTLAQTAESGGGTPAVLETTTDFVSKVRMTMKEARSSISIYVMLGYAAPILLAFTVVMIGQMLKTVSPGLAEGFGSESFKQLITITPVFESTIKMFIVTSSIGTAILLGKAADRTFKSTGRVAVISALALISIIIMERISIPGLG